MPKRVTFDLPGVSEDQSNNEAAIEQASERLAKHSIDGSVSMDYSGAAFPQADDDITDVLSMTIVCDDDHFDRDVVNTVHAFLVAQFSVPDGTRIKTHVEDIDEYFVG